MKKISLLVLGLFAVLQVLGQSITLINQNTQQPIENVVIVLMDNKQELGKTNSKGIFVLPSLNETSKIGFYHNMYVFNEVTIQQLKEQNNKVYLLENIHSLEEVVVSASKFEEKRKDVAQKIQVLRASEIQTMNQSSTADVLMNSGNVFVQKSQLGGGSPIIRGFETNKVLLVIDGVRMNNAIYRGGHLQNVITLDNSILERTEIVFGPGSVVYGSDALGGVMSFTTKNPLLSSDEKTKVKSGAYVRYMSAVSGYAAHADVSLGKKRFGSLTSFTFTNFDDLRQGAVRNPFYGSFGARNWYVERINGIDSMIVNKDTNLQVGSGYTQYDILQKFMYQQNEYTSHLINIQYSTSSNIDRYDRLTLLGSNGKPRFAEWYYGPQKRLLSSYTLTNNRANRFYNHSRLIAAYQFIEESRIDRRFKKDFRNHRIEKLDILSLNIDFDKKINSHEIRYGAEGYTNMVRSTAFTENIVVDTVGSLSTRYPDGGSEMKAFALYGTHTWEINQKLILNDGLRFSHVVLDADFQSKQFFPFPFSSVNQSNSAINGNVGLIYMPGADWRFTINASSGFRAPNVDDLSKVFESVPGSVIVPNPELKPEFTYNGELGISKKFLSLITASVTGYYTLYNNAITVQNSKFDGADSILFGGVMSQVKTNVNKGEAYLYGVEGALSGQLNKYFSVQGTVNYTYGRIVTDTTDYPLDHIPPVFGKLSFLASVNKFRGEVFVNYSGWKRLKDYNLIGEDNYSYATVNGMPSWYTLNLRAGYYFNPNIQLQVACENILDQNYRMYASNISAPGRNFIITLRGNF